MRNTFFLEESPENILAKLWDFPKIELWSLTDWIITQSTKKWEIITQLEKPDLWQVIPAIPTIFDKNNQIDYNILDKMLEEQSNTWIKEVLIAWTTWLSSLMSHEEQIWYIERASIIAKNYWLKVVAWTWANNTAEQNLLTKKSFEKWAVASLLLAPYYLKASNDMMLKHFIEALNYGPWIIYSISWRTGIQIPIEVIKKLSKHPNFIWVKECDWWDRIKELSDYWIKVWSGNDDEVINDVHKNWAHWTITVAWDINSELVQELVTNPNITKTVKNYSDLLNHAMFLPWQPNPKWVSNVVAMIEKNNNPELVPWFRLPVWVLSQKQQLYVQKIMQKLWYKTSILDNYREFS